MVLKVQCVKGKENYGFPFQSVIFFFMLGHKEEIISILCKVLIYRHSFLYQ